MDKRKLKPINQRKPKHSVTMWEISREISDELGFTSSDIRNVIKCYFERVKFHLLDRKRVRLMDSFEVYPVVTPPRQVTHMGGTGNSDYKTSILPPRWKLVMKPIESMAAEVTDIMVTKKDLENIYKK